MNETKPGVVTGVFNDRAIGALIGWGIPEERVKHYDERIKKGGILMGLRTKNDADAEHFEKTWKENKGESIYR